VSDDRTERGRMLAALYDNLRAVAARMLRREAPFLTLQPTELVDEAAMRIASLDRMSWHDRQHFFATGARILRQTMVDEIRKTRRAKRQASRLRGSYTLPIAASCRGHERARHHSPSRPFRFRRSGSARGRSVHTIRLPSPRAFASSLRTLA
jgi:DNA-directed RNA polymerase specialized sigma24 family protein